MSAEESTHHPAFLIDAVEVSCAEWEFCAATGAAPPRTWRDGYQESWARLPVVGVSADEARAYAEWRGKRLPTWFEWQIAARGPEASMFPWGDDPARLATLENLNHVGTEWFEGTRPCGTTAGDRSWCDAFDMLGNAPEWTDSPYSRRTDGSRVPVLSWRIVAGSSWESDDPDWLPLDIFAPGQPAWPKAGFRCAKSASP